MIKTIEYNDGESRLQGHVEVLKESDGLYTITSYIEDKIYGIPWEHVSPDNVSTISKKQESGISKELKKMGENIKTKNVYDNLQDKGYSAL